MLLYIYTYVRDREKEIERRKDRQSEYIILYHNLVPFPNLKMSFNNGRLFCKLFYIIAKYQLFIFCFVLFCFFFFSYIFQIMETFPDFLPTNLSEYRVLVRQESKTEKPMSECSRCIISLLIFFYRLLLPFFLNVVMEFFNLFLFFFF